MEVRKAKDGEIQPVQQDVEHPVPTEVLVATDNRPRPRILLNLKVPFDIPQGTTFAFPVEAARALCQRIQEELRDAESA